MPPRWEGDERGTGVADARAFATGIEELAAAARSERWVAEEPEAHLLPHLEQACEGLPLELVAASTAADGAFDVELRWTVEGSVGARREAVFALVGSISETATYVRQRRAGVALLFEVVTGMLERDASFAPHGHALRIHVR